MKVLLTGATGFVGKVLTEALLESHASPDIEDTQVRALLRHPRSAAAQALRELPHADGNLEFVEGDILDPTSLAEALDDGTVDAVIHLVGIIAERRGEGATFQRIHHLGTRNVVDATRNAGVDRYIHMSAMGTGPDCKAVYHQTKWAAEEYVRASGLDYTIFRPSIVYGHEDLFINRFAFFVRTKLLGVPLPNFGRTRFQPIAVEDVAEAFAQALENPKSIGNTYDLGGPNVVTLREIVAAIEDVLGTWAPKIPLPLAVAKMQAYLLQFAPYPFDLNPDQVTMMETDNVGNNAPLLRDFEIALTPFRAGIETSLRPKPAAVLAPRPSGQAAPKPKPEPEPEPEPDEDDEGPAEEARAEEPTEKPTAKPATAAEKAPAEKVPAAKAAEAKPAASIPEASGEDSAEDGAEDAAAESDESESDEEEVAATPKSGGEPEKKAAGSGSDTKAKRKRPKKKK